MIEKGKISAFQMALMSIATITATAILVVPAITSKYAGRDMWISPIYGSLNGMFTMFIAHQLHKRYPKESIIQYSGHIIGRIPGKIFSFIYLLFFLHACGVTTRQYTDFIINSFLPSTPMIVIAGSLILVSAFAVYGGVEVLGRVAQLFVPIFLASSFMFFLLLPDLNFKNMFPIMEHGIMPSLLGAVVPQAWFSEIFLISMLFPFVVDQYKMGKWGKISVFVSMSFLVFENIISIFLFGEPVSSYSYPVFSAFKYIKVVTFFENFEAVMIVIWVMVSFIKISVFFYVLVLGTAQWLHLSDYRPLVLPLGFLLILFSVWAAPNAAEMAKFLGTIAPFRLVFMMTLLPTLLLLIAIIRKKWKYKLYTAKE